MVAKSRKHPSDPPSEDVGRNRKILTATLKCFARDGYAGVTLVSLARAAGVPVSEIRRRFGGKRNLLQQSVAFRTRQLLEGLEGGDPHAPPTVYLTQLGLRLILGVLSPEAVELQRSVIRDLKRYPELGTWTRSAATAVVGEILVPQLIEWNRRGRLRIPDPRAAAEEFVGCTTARFNLRALFASGDPPARREIARHLNAMIEFFLTAHAGQ